MNTRMGFAVPGGGAEQVVGSLNAEINLLGQLPQVRDKMLTQGINMLPSGPPPAAQRLVRDDLALCLPAIRASRASAE